MRWSATAIAWLTTVSRLSTGWLGKQLDAYRPPRRSSSSQRSSGSRWSLVWYASAAKFAPMAPACSPRTGKFRRSSRPTSGHWMSGEWVFRLTTSRTISRCSSALKGSTRSKTWWAPSSRTWTTTWSSVSCTTPPLLPNGQSAGRPVRLAFVEHQPGQMYAVHQDQEAGNRGNGRGEIRREPRRTDHERDGHQQHPAPTPRWDRRFLLRI